MTSRMHDEFMLLKISLYLEIEVFCFDIVIKMKDFRNGNMLLFTLGENFAREKGIGKNGRPPNFWPYQSLLNCKLHSYYSFL